MNKPGYAEAYGHYEHYKVTNKVGRMCRLELPAKAVQYRAGRYIIYPYNFGGLGERTPLMMGADAEKVAQALGSIGRAGTWECEPWQPLRMEYEIKLRGQLIDDGKDCTEAEIASACAKALNKYGRYQNQRSALDCRLRSAEGWERAQIESIPLITSEGQRLQRGSWYTWRNVAPNEWVGTAIGWGAECYDGRALCEEYPEAEIFTDPNYRAYQAAAGELAEIDLPTWLGWEYGGYQPEGEQAVIADYYRPLQEWAHASEGYVI